MLLINFMLIKSTNFNSKNNLQVGWQSTTNIMRSPSKLDMELEAFWTAIWSQLEDKWWRQRMWSISDISHFSIDYSSYKLWSLQSWKPAQLKNCPNSPRPAVFWGPRVSGAVLKDWDLGGGGRALLFYIVFFIYF